jgi:hypothetical protein
METPSSPISDDALAESIDDTGVLSSAEVATDTDDGCIESGVAIDAGEEEGFSIDDFEAPMTVDASNENPAAALCVDDLGDSSLPSTLETEDASHEHSLESQGELLSNGEVAEFRKTLSDLSRQLEIDRLTFLHHDLRSRGKDVPDLASIASDIRGEKPIHPIGDQDIYSKRPFSRLQGWIVGLSFGIGRRAKRFRG